MKCCGCSRIIVSGDVAPFAGAWIEIDITFAANIEYVVAPFAGAWIEMELIAIFAASE